jgi:preprotein translocase subunit SecA
MPAAMLDDKIWWNLERKLAGICEEIVAIIAAGRNVLLLAHFEGTLAVFETALRTRRIEHQRFATSISSMLCRVNLDGRGKVWAGLAAAFLPANTPAANGSNRRENPPEFPLEIIVAAHHPLRSKDEQLIKAAATLACQSQLTFHISLDDPLLVHFGVTSIQHLFKQLGMEEEECLSNSLITAAIRRAQEKIESGTPKDLPAHSIADWFKYNHNR